MIGLLGISQFWRYFQQVLKRQQDAISGVSREVVTKTAILQPLSKHAMARNVESEQCTAEQEQWRLSIAEQEPWRLSIETMIDARSPSVLSG